MEAASADYDQAKCRHQQMERASSGKPDERAALLEALQIAELARERYQLTLEIFTNLVLRRKLPPVDQ